MRVTVLENLGVKEDGTKDRLRCYDPVTDSTVMVTAKAGSGLKPEEVINVPKPAMEGAFGNWTAHLDIDAAKVKVAWAKCVDLAKDLLT